MANPTPENSKKRGRPRTATVAEPASLVQALDRGLALLAAVAKEGSIGLSSLGMRAGVPPSSAYRLLLTLQHHGFVAFDESTQEWSVGLEAFRVGSSFVSRTNLVDVSRDTMRSLTSLTGETSNLAIPDDASIVVLDQIASGHPIRAFFRPATRIEMHCSGNGKAILSTYPRERLERLFLKTGLQEFTAKTITSPEALFEDLQLAHDRGWSLDDEERYEGMRCVAAPIFDPTGTAIGGVSVSGPTARMPERRIAEIGPMVRMAAEEITRKLGG